MARAAKKRKKEEDDADFNFPEFDEADYMRREVEGAKAAIAAVMLAVPVALLLFALTLAGVPVVAFFLGVLLTVSLPRIYRYLPWPKINLAGFERKDWAGHGITFFFSWLAFWVLLLNAPFADLAAPVIAGVTVNGVALAPGIQANVPLANTTWMNVTILENVGLERVDLVLNSVPVSATSVNGAVYAIERPLGAGSYTLEVTARDTSGHVTTASFQFNLL